MSNTPSHELYVQWLISLVLRLEETWLPRDLCQLIVTSYARLALQSRVAYCLARGWSLTGPRRTDGQYQLYPDTRWHVGDSDYGGLVAYAPHRSPIEVSAAFWRHTALDRTPIVRRRDYVSRTPSKAAPLRVITPGWVIVFMAMLLAILHPLVLY